MRTLLQEKQSQIREIALRLPTLSVLKVVLFMQQKYLEGGILSLPLTSWYLFCPGVGISEGYFKRTAPLKLFVLYFEE